MDLEQCLNNDISSMRSKRSFKKESSFKKERKKPIAKQSTPPMATLVAPIVQQLGELNQMFIYDTKRPTLIIDDHERALFDYLTPLKTLKINHIITNIKRGDFAIVHHGKIFKLFERKTWHDMAATICGSRNRNFNDLIDARNKSPTFIGLIMEGRLRKGTKLVGCVPIQALHGKISNLSTRDGFHIEYTDSVEDTITYLINEITTIQINTSNKLDESRSVDATSVISYHDMIMQRVDQLMIESNNSVHLIESNVSVNLVDSSLMSIRDMYNEEADIPLILTYKPEVTDFDIYQDMIYSLPGIYDKTWEGLQDAGVTLFDLFNGTHPATTLSKIKLRSGKLIGLKSAKRIFEISLLTSSTKTKKAKKMSVNVLCCVNLVSQERAESILSLYTLKGIITGTVTQEQVAACPKVGQAVAANIYRIINSTFRYC